FLIEPAVDRAQDRWHGSNMKLSSPPVLEPVCNIPGPLPLLLGQVVVFPQQHVVPQSFCPVIRYILGLSILGLEYPMNVVPHLVIENRGEEVIPKERYPQR